MSSAKKASAKKASAKKASRKASARKAGAKPSNPTKPAKAKTSPAAESALAKISALCLALPDTKLTMTWGSPHFRVAEKIFCGFGGDDGKQVMGVKLAMGHAQALVKQERFWPSPYVGKHGWVSMDVTQRKSWDEVAALIRESYELIAPKAALAKLR
jgi:predicted DNA-binding protein (MmcQ/YjbR family)